MVVEDQPRLVDHAVDRAHIGMVRAVGSFDHVAEDGPLAKGNLHAHAGEHEVHQVVGYRIRVRVARQE
jgi:hypothetical protein